MCTFGLSGSKRAHFRVPALPTPPKFHEKTPREREKERKWGREREKSAKFWASRLRALTLRAPTLHCPKLGAPTLRTPTLGALTFSRSGPHSSGPRPFGPLPFERRLSRPPLFLGLGSYVPHFYHVARLFFLCVFLIVSISCHF